MLPALLDFVRALRRAGVPVAVSDDLDAMRALAFIPMQDRTAFRATLATTMIKNEAHRPAFDTLFDLYFGTGRGPEALERRDSEDEPPSSEEDYLEELFRAMLAGDQEALRDLARRAVAQFGRVETDRAGSPYFEYRVFRVVDLNTLMGRMMREMGQGRDPTPLEERLWRDEVEARARRFREEVQSEVRRRLAEHKGAERVAKHAVRPLPEDLEFVRATRDEILQLRRAIGPLARRLATRLAMKRKHARRGRLDVRKTVRASLSTGGVPFETRFRHRSPHKPELFVLCDISGSVSAFARFTLMFVHAFQAQFSRVRSFVFVDTLDEVTHLFEHEDFLAAVDRMNAEAQVVWLDGHSDYGTSLERFWSDAGSALGPRASVLILGDARNNYRESGSWVIKEMRKKAKRVYWLNPEPRQHWDTGDSIAEEYARHADGMVEVRNLRQLESFIQRV
ncbi:MAG: VWA domain-containing protein, partial [Actinomycetota bacterium]